jgi:hypothetical protein
MLQNASTAPSVGKGGIYYDTDDNNAYVNKGTYASPNWQVLGGGDADTLDGYHAVAFALLASDNIFTGDHQIIRGVGGSQANYPTIALRNTSFNAGDFDCLFLDDSGYVNVGIDGLSVKLFGGVNSVGNIRPTAADTYDLGTSTYWWNEVFAQKYYIDDTSTYINNNAGDCEIHIASGKVVKIIVG